MKIIDIDNLFDNYISDYVYKNIGKVKPEEIENKIPTLYLEFGKTKLKELDGLSPEEYYQNASGSELLECLKEHLIEGVSVPDFLCVALSDKKNENLLINELDADSGEEYTLYLMNMLVDMGSKNCASRYLEMVVFDYSEPIKELATEYLKENAELVKDSVLSQFNECEEKVKEYLSEILSGCKKDDRVFDILINQFVKNQHQIPIYASYLSKFGDERALPFLMKVIDDEKITYADFEELRFAIEALGGEYNKVRDFKKDKTYKKIKLGDKKEEYEN
jgi:hypothetical protein